VPEIDLSPDDWNRERASADRVAGIGEKRDARGFEEPADGGVVAVAKGIEIREPDPVLDPMAVEGRLKAVRGGHKNLLCLSR